mmetsp:Transcript_15011/g.56954  ORF Transcript_15011/g.56954 Transcript_15011/m.56954 type:complete len:246 (-) Transcript_15011:72-809(-)
MMLQVQLQDGEDDVVDQRRCRLQERLLLPALIRVRRVNVLEQSIHLRVAAICAHEGVIPLRPPRFVRRQSLPPLPQAAERLHHRLHEHDAAQALVDVQVRRFVGQILGSSQAHRLSRGRQMRQKHDVSPRIFALDVGLHRGTRSGEQEKRRDAAPDQKHNAQGHQSCAPPGNRQRQQQRGEIDEQKHRVHTETEHEDLQRRMGGPAKQKRQLREVGQTSNRAAGLDARRQLRRPCGALVRHGRPR